MSNNTTRRGFMFQSATAATALWVTGKATPVVAKNANEQLNIACIGVGGKGRTDAKEIAKHGKVVAICDIDDKRLNVAASIYKEAKKFNDYRELFNKMEGKVDAVTVTTPDHMHAPISLMAMKKGIHVYCQKPLVHSVDECRTMREMAKKYNVVTQMGNQGTSQDGFREAVEIIRDGAIGDIKEVHVWTNRPGKWWKQGIKRPTATPAVPKHVHWDLFCGVVPDRPYSPLYHPFHWRAWMDFGCGAIGDMACHTMNMAVMALDLYNPTTIEVESSGIVDNETFPLWGIYHFSFPKRGNFSATKLTWYEGNKLPDSKLFMGHKPVGSGLLFVGEKGTIYSPNDSGSKILLLPKKKFADYKKPEPSLPRIHSEHYKEFADACKGSKVKPMSNFEYASRLTETALLGLVALQAGKKIEWDSKNMRVKNGNQDSIFLKREYRNGWT